MNSISHIFEYAMTHDEAARDLIFENYWAMSEIIDETLHETFIHIGHKEYRQCQLCGNYPIVYNDRYLHCDNPECLNVRKSLQLNRDVHPKWPNGSSKDPRVISAKKVVALAVNETKVPLKNNSPDLLRIPFEFRFAVAKECARFLEINAIRLEMFRLTQQLTKEIQNVTE